MPFKVFGSRSAFFPLLPLELVDDLLLQKRGFLISSINPILATHPVVKADILGESASSMWLSFCACLWHRLRPERLSRVFFVSCSLCLSPSLSILFLPEGECWAALFLLRAILSVDVDAAEVKVQNPSLEPLLRLTDWEQHFARRVALETAFANGAAEGQGSCVNGGSSSISRHATDLLQQTISSLAIHAAAHGLPFLKPKDEGRPRVWGADVLNYTSSPVSYV